MLYIFGKGRKKYINKNICYRNFRLTFKETQFFIITTKHMVTYGNENRMFSPVDVNPLEKK